MPQDVVVIPKKDWEKLVALKEKLLNAVGNAKINKSVARALSNLANAVHGMYHITISSSNLLDQVVQEIEDDPEESLEIYKAYMAGFSGQSQRAPLTNAGTVRETMADTAFCMGRKDRHDDAGLSNRTYVIERIHKLLELE